MMYIYIYNLFCTNYFLATQSVIVVAPPKGKKRGKVPDALKDFGIEYSLSSRAVCCGCKLKIMKGEIRAKKTVYDTDVGMKYGGQPLWHHIECFDKVTYIYSFVFLFYTFVKLTYSS